MAISIDINKTLAESFEVKTKEEFIQNIKLLYQDAKNLNRINYYILVDSILSLIDWNKYKEYRMQLNKNYIAKD